MCLFVLLGTIPSSDSVWPHTICIAEKESVYLQSSEIQTSRNQYYTTDELLASLLFLLRNLPMTRDEFNRV